MNSYGCFFCQMVLPKIQKLLREAQEIHDRSESKADDLEREAIEMLLEENGGVH
jgi:uncharacterized protein Yka (UPF0111/DUF47 family)